MFLDQINWNRSLNFNHNWCPPHRHFSITPHRYCFYRFLFYLRARPHTFKRGELKKKTTRRLLNGDAKITSSSISPQVSFIGRGTAPKQLPLLGLMNSDPFRTTGKLSCCDGMSLCRAQQIITIRRPDYMIFKFYRRHPVNRCILISSLGGGEIKKEKLIWWTVKRHH